MAISISWDTKVINIPKADLQLVQANPTEIRQLDLDNFRLTLRDLEDGAEGILFPFTHNHVAPINVGGVSLARVIEIVNGYTITFEDGQYAVNLSGANSNIGDVTNVNQVSVRSANSAGLTYSKQIEDLAFGDGRVHINTNTGLPGTSYPRGTTTNPVNNLSDAQAIISERGLDKSVYLVGSLNILETDDISDYDFLGKSVVLSQLIVTTGAGTTNLVVQDCEITGDLNGNVTARRATSFTNLDDFDGTLHGTGLGGTITLEYNGRSHEFIDCYSQEGGTATPIVDCQSMTNPEIYFRRYSGGVEIRNFTSGAMTIGGPDCRVILHSSCTGGTIKLYGTMELEDNSNGSVVVKSGIVAELINSYIVDGSVTFKQLLRGFGAAILGRSSGTATQDNYLGLDGSTTRVQTTTDANNKRTLVSLDLD